MQTEKKARIISAILASMRIESIKLKKAFDEGDSFFSLCFKSDKELKNIARLLDINLNQY